MTHLKKGKYSQKELSDLLEIDRRETREVLNTIEAAGYILQSQKVGNEQLYFIGRQTVSGETHYISGAKNKATTLKWGLVGDTHLNSWHHNKEALDSFYADAKKAGIQKYIQVGDVQEGNGKMYREQMLELKLFGFDKVADHVVKEYPKEGNLETILIGGNHDDSWVKQEGADIVKAIASERKDMKYLGMYVADIVEDGVRFRMLHPEGGGTYARSYTIQKYIRNLMPEDRPDVIIYGHLHQFLHMNEQGVEVIGLPAFQSATGWLARKGIQSQVGGVIADFDIEKGKLQGVNLRKIDYT